MDTFDLVRARAAYSWNSFHPDRAAECEARWYAEHVAETRAALEPLAVSDAQRALLDAEMDRYAAGYLEQTYAVLGAKARTASSMVTGPANFPTARNRKALGLERRRDAERDGWSARAAAAIRRGLLAARTGEQAEDDATRVLVIEIRKDLAAGAAIDAGRMPGFDRGAWTTSATGRIKRAADRGDLAAVRAALAVIRETQAGWAKPFVTARHGVWGLADAADATASADRPTGEEVLSETPTARVVRNHDADRVQIFFAAKPDESTRAMLKAGGWRWSPSNGAWQRQNTNAAAHAASRIVA